MARRMTEAQLHKAVAQYLAAALPPECVWTTFPAGGGGKVRGAQLKARGLRPGWPDIQLVVGGSFVGIELKTPSGKVDAEQIACHDAIRKAGGYVFVCRSMEGVAAVLRGLGVPIHAAVMAGGGWVRLAA